MLLLLHGDVKFMEGCPAIVLLLTGVQLSINLLVGVGYVFFSATGRRSRGLCWLRYSVK